MEAYASASAGATHLDTCKGIVPIVYNSHYHEAHCSVMVHIMNVARKPGTFKTGTMLVDFLFSEGLNIYIR